jgi:DNA ligase-1
MITYEEMPTVIMPTLYKKTSTGATQIWYRELDGNRYRTISGQIDGQKTASGWTVCKGKNEGRSNETSPEEQAELECNAAYVKKLAQGGYHEKLEDIEKVKYFKPMLAESYDKHFPGFEGQDKYSQPKLDGIRMIATRDGLWTRQGKPIVAVPHIAEALKPYFDEHPDAILDGELYAVDLHDDFNKIISLVRKVNPDPDRVAEAAAIIKYHVYDMPSVKGPFTTRYGALTEAMDGYHPCIEVVETWLVTNQQHLDDLMSGYLEAGYEGQIIRVSSAHYENKRSKQLLKRKNFIDQEYKIVEIQEGEGNQSGMAGTVVYELGDGRTFRSGIKGDWDYRRDLLKRKDDYVGGEGTVRYFQLTPGGVPRFPVTVALFEEKRDV